MTDENYMRPGLDFAVGKTIEEAGEVLHALGKTLRWGWQSADPTLPKEEQESNYDWVVREMDDLENALVNLRKEMELYKGTLS